MCSVRIHKHDPAMPSFVLHCLPQFWTSGKQSRVYKRYLFSGFHHDVVCKDLLNSRYYLLAVMPGKFEWLNISEASQCNSIWCSLLQQLIFSYIYPEGRDLPRIIEIALFFRICKFPNQGDQIWAQNASDCLQMWQMRDFRFVSHPCGIKHKTLLVKNELNAFSNRGYFYGHFEKKIIQISQKLTKWWGI